MKTARRPSLRSVHSLAFLVCVASASPVAAEWRRVDSPNFVVVGEVGARELQEIAVKFEGFRETLSRVLTERATATAVPTVVIVFRSDRAFTPVKPTYNGKPIELAGYFMPRQDANYIAVVADGRPDRMHIVFHEYAHLITSNTSRHVPTWLSEGLAEYYSTFEVRNGGREALLGRPVGQHLDLLREGRLLPLGELLNVDSASSLYNEGNRRSIFYAQSWALTHLILLGEPIRTKALLTYLTSVGEGAPPLEAWKTAFGPNMEQDLHNYVRREVFRAYQYKFPDKLATFDAPATPLTPADAQSFLGDFLLKQRRYDEAAERLAEGAKLDPSNPRIAVTRALLHIERQDYESAEKQLLGMSETGDWLTAYFAGTAISELVENRSEAAGEHHVQMARQLFGRASTERGDLPNALARLASLEARAPEPPSLETRAGIERARSLAPGRHDYVFVHAQVLVRRSEFSAARQILGPLLTPAYPENIRNSARRLMQEIVRIESARRTTPAPSSSAPAAGSAATTSEPGSRGLQPVFRRLEAGEQRLEGMLEQIECRGASAVLHVRAVDGLVRLTAPRMSEVDFITYRDDVSGAIACGPLATPLRVYVAWKPGSTSDARVAVAIEFLPKD